ncbi:MAG: hypothetical protein K6U09_02390 [Acidobacteriia bacterium]|jgi:hypothetical protein|nr:hypothetical protein [Terriglobia bacterium]
MDAASVAIALACVALTGAVLVFVFRVEHTPEDALPHRTRLDQLLERRDTIYENLRDLKFEYRAGKYSDRDFEQMKEALEAEAAQVIAEIELLTGGVVSPAVRQAAAKARVSERTSSP